MPKSGLPKVLNIYSGATLTSTCSLRKVLSRYIGQEDTLNKILNHLMSEITIYNYSGLTRFNLFTLIPFIVILLAVYISVFEYYIFKSVV